MTNNILNEDNDFSPLVNKLVANWLHETNGEEVTVQTLVDFLQQDKITRVLPYNPDITDEIINTIAAKRVSSGFGASKKGKTDQAQPEPDRAQPEQAQSDQAQPDQEAASPNEDRVRRVTAQIDKLSAEEQTELARMLQ